jgi:hypothetical protein
MARSPREPGLIAPVIARLVTARLDLSVGRPGPRAFASASAPFVRTKTSRASPTRPSHPASRFVTIAHTPLSSRRDGADHAPDLGSASSLFLNNGINADCDRLARRAVCARRSCADCPSGNAELCHRIMMSPRSWIVTHHANTNAANCLSARRADQGATLVTVAPTSRPRYQLVVSLV